MSQHHSIDDSDINTCNGNESHKKNEKLEQLFARITQEIEEKCPANIIYFIVDFLCKHYPEHLGGFARVWGGGWLFQVFQL